MNELGMLQSKQLGILAHPTRAPTFRFRKEAPYSVALALATIAIGGRLQKSGAFSVIVLRQTSRRSLRTPFAQRAPWPSPSLRRYDQDELIAGRAAIIAL